MAESNRHGVFATREDLESCPGELPEQEQEMCAAEEVIQFELEELRHELHGIRDKPDYSRAREQDPVHVEEHHKLYVSGVGRRPSDAAHLLVTHFKVKNDLWAPHKLTKTITRYDLTPDERKCLNSSAIQVLPRKDNSGRRVFLFDWRDDALKKLTPKSQQRVLWYELNFPSASVAHDDTILVIYGVGPSDNDKGRGASLLANFLEIAKASPLYIVGIYVCCSATGSLPVDSSHPYVMTLSRQAGFQLREIVGNHEAVRSALDQLGMPMDKFPIDSEGGLNCRSFRKQLTGRKRKETSIAKMAGVGPTDVLVAKGNLFQNNPANKRFKEFLMCHQHLGSNIRKELDNSREAERFEFWIPNEDRNTRGWETNFWVLAPFPKIWAKVENLLNRRTTTSGH